MRSKGEHYGGWRAYQRRLRMAEKKNRIVKRMPILFAYSGGSFLLLVLLFCVASWVSGTVSRNTQLSPEVKKEPDSLPEKITPQGLPSLIRDVAFTENGLPERFSCGSGARLTAFTSIDKSFEEYIARLLKRSGAVQAAVVVMNPADGRVLAMVSHPDEEGTGDLCLQASFPAASLFKIVAAAAALESAGFSPDKPVRFFGKLHTLYKSQIKEGTARYANETSFRKAFARSINPVFGNLGAHKLGEKVIEEYSSRFFFNRKIPFELPVGMSIVEVPEDDYGLAEVASGFNKRTLISPLHAALIAGAAANDGTMMVPWVVSEIRDPEGKLLYKGSPSPLASPISGKTASELRVMMRDTVTYGTCRRSFGAIRRKKHLQHVELGAKTGTINDKMDQFKIDWLAGYALPAKGKEESLCIAVLAVHGEKLGIRANQLARYIIDFRFKS